MKIENYASAMAWNAAGLRTARSDATGGRPGQLLQLGASPLVVAVWLRTGQARGDRLPPVADWQARGWQAFCWRPADAPRARAKLQELARSGTPTARTRTDRCPDGAELGKHPPEPLVSDQ